MTPLESCSLIGRCPIFILSFACGGSLMSSQLCKGAFQTAYFENKNPTVFSLPYLSSSDCLVLANWKDMAGCLPSIGCADIIDICTSVFYIPNYLLSTIKSNWKTSDCNDYISNGNNFLTNKDWAPSYNILI